MLVSILIPAYKEEKNISRTIKLLKKYLTGEDFQFEAIIICDGTADRTFAISQSLAGEQVKAVAYKTNRGKGYALKYGFNYAKGEIIIFFDAGLDFPPQDIKRFINYFKQTNLPIIVGSKRHKLSRVYYPWFRRCLSFGGQTITKILLGLNVKDSHVGLKLFQRDVLEKIFPRLLVKRYAFDIELLALANYFGYPIAEAPVNLRLNLVASSVGFRAICQTLWDTLAVFYRLKILKFYDKSPLKPASLVGSQDKNLFRFLKIAVSRVKIFLLH